jgi:COMPASS component SWD3
MNKIGYSNGSIAIYNLDRKDPVKYIKASEYPITSIRWKPHNELKPKNILVSVSADGNIIHWHTSTGKQLHIIKEENNPIMCIDYSKDGNFFSTVGNDIKVRIYDENTKTLLRIMKPGSFDHPGHSNRIFSVNFHKENTNMMATGGWDNTIQFYDLRQGTIINSLYGPHLCGDSLDMKGDYLLTGSWALENQIQIWDLRTYKLLETVKWGKENKNSTYVYTAQFSKGNKNNLFSVGGSNNNIFTIFDNSKEFKIPVMTTNFMNKACYAIDFSNNGNMVAYGGGDGIVKVLNIGKNL